LNRRLVERNRLSPEPKRYIREWHHTSHPDCPARQRTTDDAKIAQFDQRFVLGVQSMEVRRRMIRQNI
jgi:hypothetical protein